MHTWSLESAFVKAYSAAAVAVQGLIDAAHTVEQLSRPVQRDVRDGAEELAEAEEQQEVWEPGDPLTDELRADGWEFTPIPEPALTSDELIGVRGLLQERYEDAWTPEGRCVFCGATKGYVAHSGGCVGPLCPHKDFAGAAASLADSHPGHPALSPNCGLSVREDKQQDKPAAPHATSPVASATSDSGGEVASVIPPDVPSSPRPPWSDLADALVEHKPSAKEPDVVAVIDRVLSEHRPAVDYTGVYCNTNSDDGPHDYYENWQAWRDHVAPLIAEALAPQHHKHLK